MIRWILDRKWFSLSIYAAVFFLFSAGFELVNSNYVGLALSTIFGVAAFISKRIPWIAIVLIPIAAYLTGTVSAAQVISIIEIAGLIALVSIFGDRRSRILVTVAGLLSAGIVGITLGYQGQFVTNLFNSSDSGELSKVNSLLVLLSITALLFMLAATFGRLLYMRMEHVGSPEDKAYASIRAGKLRLEIAKQNERLEIAKDLSELLVQRISAVVSVTEGGMYAISTDPNAAARVLERSYDAGRAAQSELRRLYDYLNSAIISDVASFRISDLFELAVAYRELGYNAVISEQGQSFPLNEGMELCVYKIVFEALKNVKKHTPIGTEIGIDFLWVEDGLQILVKDNGIEVANREKVSVGELVIGYDAVDDLDALVNEFDGATLSALRDRAAIYKGRIEATVVPGVGFTLSAIFPNLRALAAQDF